MRTAQIIIFFVFSAHIVSGCSSLTSSDNIKYEYPETNEDERRIKRGKLSGKGITLFGGDKKNQSGGGAIIGTGVNNFLWRAALETVSFVPLASADPIGGVIITEWYSTDEDERIKLNVFILDTKLHSKALKVSSFRQEKDDDEWEDAKTSVEFSTEIENKILARARELKVNRINP